MKPELESARPERFLDETKALACIHCGLCLSSCPTYLETGNENDSPRGRIYLMRAVQEGRLPLGNTAVRHIDLCLGCRACEAVCPSGVQYGELLETTRDHIEHRHRRSLLQRLLRRVLIEQIFPFPDRMKAALLPVKVIRALGLNFLLPAFAREAMTLVPDSTPQINLPEHSPASTASARGTVGFISGCVMSVMFGKTNASSIQLLNQCGYDVITPEAQACCGALYAHGGNLDRARECARHNIEVFERAHVEAVIINAAGCGSTLKEYHQLLQHDPQWSERALRFSQKVRDLTEWLVQSASAVSPIARTDGDRVTYHDACHLAHPQRITQEPRTLIRRVAGTQFVELPESDVCCGSAGSYNLTEPAMAERLQKRKIENILKTGATLVVTTNPGCLLQIRAGLQKAGAGHIRCLHIADYLASAHTTTAAIPK